MQLNKLDCGLPGVKIREEQSLKYISTERVYNKYPKLFKPCSHKYSKLKGKEKFLADLLTTNRIIKFYYKYDNSNFYFELDISSPDNSTGTVIFNNHYPHELVSTDTTYTYHKLNQWHFHSCYAFCRVDKYTTRSQREPITIYIPIEFNKLYSSYHFYDTIYPVVKFNNSNDDKMFISSYMNDFYDKRQMYLQLSSSLSIEDLMTIEEKRTGFKKRQNIVNNSLYLVELFETYLPYLMLSFVQFDGIVDDIKFKILEQLNFSKQQNVLRILNYRDEYDIRRILPHLIENMDNGKGYKFK